MDIKVTYPKLKLTLLEILSPALQGLHAFLIILSGASSKLPKSKFKLISVPWAFTPKSLVKFLGLVQNFPTPRPSLKNSLQHNAVGCSDKATPVIILLENLKYELCTSSLTY